MTIIQLNAVLLSIGSVTPASGSAGSTVTIRGSGFTSGTAVSFNGTAVTAQFVDPDTLRVTIPSLTAGPVQIVVANLGGQAYFLDDTFVIQ